MHGFLLFWVLVPIQAHLFFRWDPAQRQESGAWQLELVASQGDYQLDQHDEVRTYVPELRYSLQLYQRMGLGVEAFGLLREEHGGAVAPGDGQSHYGGGDETIVFWLDLYRPPGRADLLRFSFRAKLPSADQASGNGSDQTDLFFGLTGSRTRENWALRAGLRLDIVGRADREGQWDYLTAAVRGSWQRGKWTLFVEDFYRTRFSNTTNLAAIGVDYHWNARWSLELSAGDGSHRNWEFNPDSRLDYQAALTVSRRGQSARLREWMR